MLIVFPLCFICIMLHAVVLFVIAFSSVIVTSFCSCYHTYCILCLRIHCTLTARHLSFFSLQILMQKRWDAVLGRNSPKQLCVRSSLCFKQETSTKSTPLNYIFPPVSDGYTKSETSCVYK